MAWRPPVRLAARHLNARLTYFHRHRKAGASAAVVRHRRVVTFYVADAGDVSQVEIKLFARTPASAAADAAQEKPSPGAVKGVTNGKGADSSGPIKVDSKPLTCANLSTRIDDELKQLSNQRIELLRLAADIEQLQKDLNTTPSVSNGLRIVIGELGHLLGAQGGRGQTRQLNLATLRLAVGTRRSIEFNIATLQKLLDEDIAAFKTCRQATMPPPPPRVSCNGHAMLGNIYGGQAHQVTADFTCPKASTEFSLTVPSGYQITGGQATNSASRGYSCSLNSAMDPVDCIGNAPAGSTTYVQFTTSPDPQAGRNLRLKVSLSDSSTTSFTLTTQ